MDILNENRVSEMFGFGKKKPSQELEWPNNIYKTIQDIRNTSFDMIGASDPRIPGINHVMVAQEFGNYAQILHDQIEKATQDQKIQPEVKKRVLQHLYDFSREIDTNLKNYSHNEELIPKFIVKLLEILGLTD